MSDFTPASSDVNLPDLPTQMLKGIASLTSALHIPRDVLAPDEQILAAWQNLPRELREIPQQVDGESLARMCVAVSVGLFDSAVNYIWNITTLHLRQRIRSFGLLAVSQMLQEQFEEGHLTELQDSRLIEFCLKLNLITEDGFFFLNQCREIRNKFSAAHPAIGTLNDREFIVFLNRCARYALSDETSLVGVDFGEFIGAIKGERFTESQGAAWVDRLNATHDPQRQLLFGNLHGIYCDSSAAETARLNALDLCVAYQSKFSVAIRSELIDRHSSYITRGDEPRMIASRQFFERLGLLELLTASERHSILSAAVDQLWHAHLGLNNFYTEPPFAQRLKDISDQGAIPETIQEAYVTTVVGCYIGNGYGVSWAAKEGYSAMIRAFSPKEIQVLASLAKSKSIVGQRIQDYPDCRRRIGDALRLIDTASLGAGGKAEFERLKQEFPSQSE